MNLSSLLSRKERLLSIDIGASGIKLVELDVSPDAVTLVNIGSMPIEGEVFSSNMITETDKVAEVVGALLEASGVDDKRVITSVPGPTVFTKKIKIAKQPYSDLVANVQMEASNFIPHNIDAVKLDFHILKEVGQNQLELLVVAVKQEVVDALVDSLALCGLELAIVDVDYFALQNIFEHSYPEHVHETVALVDFGSRYSIVNIVAKGASLFTGDVSAGGKNVVESLSSTLGIGKSEAEKITSSGGRDEREKDALANEVDSLGKEFNRQLSFFWSAAGAEKGIDRIMLTGGPVDMPGFLEVLRELTGLPCEKLNPLKNIKIGEDIDPELAEQQATRIAIACGMGLREIGDRTFAEDL